MDFNNDETNQLFINMNNNRINDFENFTIEGTCTLCKSVKFNDIQTISVYDLAIPNELVECGPQYQCE
jgi:hypothetical protein